MKEIPLRVLLIWIFIFFLLSCAPEEVPVLPGTQVEPESSNLPVEEAVQETPLETPSIAEEDKTLSKIETTPPEKVDSKSCGDFFDAYTRITGGPQDGGEVEESELVSLLSARMKENNVGCAVLVTIDVTEFGTIEEIQESIDNNYKLLKPYSAKFIPFLDLDSESSSDFTVERLQQILTAAEGKINYRGFGEVSFVDPGPWKNKKLTDEPLPEIIQFLGKNELFFAAHIRNGQIAELDTILAQYPNTKILVHGKPSGIKESLVKHKNLYYAAELEIMLSDGTFSCSVSVSDGKIDSAVKQYGPIIAAAPEQVIFATNAHSKCHFQPQFYSTLIEFANKFIKRLPEEHRKPFAYANAVKLFGIQKNV